MVQLGKAGVSVLHQASDPAPFSALTVMRYNGTQHVNIGRHAEAVWVVLEGHIKRSLHRHQENALRMLNSTSAHALAAVSRVHKGASCYDFLS
jgi:hypothetical protein